MSRRPRAKGSLRRTMANFRWDHNQFMTIPRFVIFTLLLSCLSGCAQIDTLRGSSNPLSRAEQMLRDDIRLKRPLDNAIVEFDKAIAADRNNIDVYLAIMDICARAGKPDLVAKYGEMAKRCNVYRAARQTCGDAQDDRQRLYPARQHGQSHRLR